MIVNPTQAMAAGAPLIRDDKENQHDNVVYDWEVGDKAGTDRAFAQADLVSKLELHYPRSHPSPLECCGSIADFNRATSKLTVYMTTQAPHIIRAAVALVAELPEHMIRIVSPDLGGGFGNKVPVYPGYVMSILASILLERPVKWIEDKTGNLISTGFGRDVYLHGEMALRKDGKILGVRMHTDADHGAFFSDAQPSKFKIGLMHSAFACYDIPAAHLTARGMYTNKAPGGVAYRCSFRVTEAMFFQERMVQAAADDLGMDQAEFRRMNFVRDDDFPHRTPFGFLTDSGQYGKCLDVGLEAIGYTDFLKQKEEARKRGRLLGIGISTMTEPLGAGNSREYDILGIKMFDSAELRVHMTGKAILRTGAKSQGQGHETTWAQIVSHELGLPAEDVTVEEGDTDTAPFGMGTYASRSTPVAGAAVAMVSRKVRAKARKLAAHLLEVSEEDVEWELGRFYVRSAPDRGVTIQECAMAAYSNMPDGMEPGLENVAYYDPPNLTWPFGCYIVTVEVDPETGVWDVLSTVAVDDCGVRINPMIVEGQIMGGLDRGLRHGQHAVHHLRRRGQLRRLQLHGLPAADRLGDARLRAARGRDAVPAPPHRREGRRRVRHGRRACGFRQRGDGRAQGHRRPQHRHAVAAGPGLRGPHRAARRLRGTAGEVGRLMSSGVGASAEGWDVVERAGELARRGEEFALATVVWRQGPSSGQQGSRAIVTATGQLYGWIGGACAEPVVIREAQRVIREGEPQLLLLGTAGAVRGGGAGRDESHPDLLPERGCHGGVRRAGAPGTAPGDRRTLADGPHPGRPGHGPRLGQRPDRRAGLLGGGPGRTVDRRRRHPRSRRRGGDRARGGRVPGLRRPGRVTPSRGDRPRLPRRPRSAAGPARPGAGTDRAGPRQHHPPRDRGRDPGRAGPAARVRAHSPRRTSCPRPQRPPRRRRRRSTRCAG